VAIICVFHRGTMADDHAMMEFTVGPAAADAADFAAVGAVTTPSADTTTFQPVGAWFKSQLTVEVDEEVDVAGAGAAEDEFAQYADKIECPNQKNFDCDPANWRAQDHYALLGIKSLGFPTYRIPEELIHLAMKKQTMWNHPDKKSHGDWTDADRELADGFFTCIKKAHETLTNTTDRRMFDSIDVPEGYDDIPKETKDAAKFWKDYPAAFERNARWVVGNPPPLGDDDMSEEDVNKFYDFWYSAETWREFGYHDEQPADNDSRDQRRYVEKKNKAARKKQQKEERARLLKFIDNAHSSDPRLKRFRKERKAAKAAKEQNAKEEAERAKREAAEKEAAEAERKLAEEKAARDMNKNAKEMLKRAKRGFVKALKRHGLLEEADGTIPEGGVSRAHADKLKDTLPAERLRAMMEMGDKAELQKEVAAEVEALVSGVARVVEVKKEWSQEEQQLLEKAMKEVPKEAADRWAEIAKLVPGRSKGEVMMRVKQLMAEIAIKKASAPSEWTEEEKTVLVKAASKVYPPGTQPDPNLGDRWGQIAAYVQTHAHTSWKRGAKDIIAQVNAMKDVAGGLAARKGADAFESFEREKGKGRDKSVVPKPKKK